MKMVFILYLNSFFDFIFFNEFFTFHQNNINRHISDIDNTDLKS